MIKVKTEHLAANVVHFVVDIVTIVETIISLDSLDPLDNPRITLSS